MKTFEEIYAENHARLYRLAVRMLNDREGASDIVQEVFLALYEKLSGGTAVMYLNTWLYRVTLNKCNDHLKRQKKHLALEEVREEPVEDPTTDRHEQELMVQRTLSLLKPTERALLLLYGEGLSYKEMAEATGIRFSSIGKTLARSLEKMEELLKSRSYEMY